MRTFLAASHGQQHASIRLGKSLQKLDEQFNSYGLATVRSLRSGSFNIGQNKLDNLARFSLDDQKKIFFAEDLNVPGRYVIGDKDIYYADLDAWNPAFSVPAESG